MKRIYKEFFYVPEHAEVPDRVFKTRTILSFLTSLVCFMIFCSSTYSWFNSNRNCDIQPIQTAEVLLTVQSDEWQATSDNENCVTDICPLATNDIHSFTIANVGTASTGYCVINAGGETFSTVQIEKGDSLTLIIQAAMGTEITFSANWGSYQNATATDSVSEGNSYPVYGDRDCIVISTTPYEVYTIAEGATLELIAKYYGVSASDILLYNGIEELTVGEEIKIPNTTVTEPFVLEEIPTMEEVATPPNATPSDAEETIPNEDEAVVPGTEEITEPDETESEEKPETTVPAETEPTTSVESEQADDSTEDENVPASTEAPPEETTSEETGTVDESEEIPETSPASMDEIIEPTSVPETTASEETTTATESESTNAQ